MPWADRVRIENGVDTNFIGVGYDKELRAWGLDSKAKV
jgi:hypothetical protein